MESKDFSSIIRGRKKTIFFVAFLFLILVMIATFVQPLKYKATTKILVTQSFGPASDAYSVSKSNQFVSNVLAQIIYSDIFFDDVLKSGYSIDKNYFSTNENKRKEQWQDMIQPIVLNDAGVIVINTYHPDKYQVNQINQAVAYTLKTKHTQYHGFGTKISVKVIDKSITSRFPVKPNVILNALFGIVAGIALGVIFVYLNPKKEKIKIAKKKNNHIQYSEPHEDKNEERFANEGGYEDESEEEDELEGDIDNIFSR